MKVLIISHNPISTYNNMGKTLKSLFSCFYKNELCQLYVYPSVPDTDMCESYFRITDKDILKFYYTFHVDGKEIKANHEQHAFFENKADEKLYQGKNNHAPYKDLLRDCIWKCANWYNRDLKKWLIKEKPTVIFVAPGTAKFLYDMAMHISKRLDIPIITYVCDDFYFTKKSKNIDREIQQWFLKRKIEKIMQHTAHLVTICDPLQKKYSERFKIAATTIMTGSSYQIAQKAKFVENPTVITYMGNIRCNRYKSIADIGYALDQINNENNTSYKLQIYTGEKSKEILMEFNDIKSINFCGFVSGQEFDRVFHSAEILLHTEAFDDENMDIVKYSISTKIADSLGSGVPLFAYGPASLASICYLDENKCAVVVNSVKDLKKNLIKIFLIKI